MPEQIAINKTINNVEGYIGKQVNQTVLGNCLYFNHRNLNDYSSGKTKDEQYSNYLLLQTISSEYREKIQKGDFRELKIRVRVFGDKNRQKILAEKLCAFSRAGKAYTISWDKSIKVALQRIFPVSTSLAIACGAKLGIEKESFLYESIGIAPFVEENGPGGWDIFPVRVINEDSLSPDIKLLLGIAKDYSSDLFLSTSKECASERAHDNAIESSTEWRDASEFTKKITSKQNCIYTLVSDPDVYGRCKVYVGEAVVSGNRLKIFKTSTGKICIDHTKKEAEEHQFTRFRIDTLKEDARAFLHDAQDSVIGILWTARK